MVPLAGWDGWDHLLDLGSDEWDSLVSLPLLDVLTAAVDDLEAVVDGGSRLLSNELVALLEDITALRVAEDRPLDTEGLQHRGGDLASVGTVVLGEDVLGGDTPILPQGLLDHRQEDGWSTDDDLDRALDLGVIQDLKESGCLLLGLWIRLPVATNEELARAHKQSEVSRVFGQSCTQKPEVWSQNRGLLRNLIRTIPRRLPSPHHADRTCRVKHRKTV